MERFDAWLRESPIQPRPDFAQRVRARMRQEPETIDAVIDRMLRPNPFLQDPQMVARIRERIGARAPSRRPAPWFQWLSPIAAAATLAFAFFSFQGRAPEPAAGLEISAAWPAQASTNTELTEIFALAANLHSRGDLAALQSVDDLAFLFE
jgi:hypothetical protein